MSITKLKNILLGATVLLFMIAALFTSQSVSANDNLPNFHRWYLQFGFDVAEIGSRFVPDDDPFVDGLPAYGNSFITQGYIYPAGTLEPCTEPNCGGVNEDGSAQWPEKVIGKWTCFGWHVADAATAASGAAVVTTQIYEFSDVPGKVSFVSDGFELAFFDTNPIRRAVTGGTGPLSSVRGQVRQKFLGFANASGGVNLKFKASMRRY